MTQRGLDPRIAAPSCRLMGMQITLIVMNIMNISMEFSQTSQDASHLEMKA